MNYHEESHQSGMIFFYSELLSEFFEGAILFLLVSEGRMQIFRTLEQPLLGEKLPELREKRRRTKTYLILATTFCKHGPRAAHALCSYQHFRLVWLSFVLINNMVVHSFVGPSRVFALHVGVGFEKRNHKTNK